MDTDKIIACVTGASGMIGSKIVERLLTGGYRVRALTRRRDYHYPGVDIYLGGLEDSEILQSFIDGAHLLFHCAAELKNQSEMWNVNDGGTKRLLAAARQSCIRYLCHFSTVDVVGLTKRKWVNEACDCNPISIYGRSKWKAEKAVAQGIEGCRVVILRPNNVICESRPGAFSLPMKGSWVELLQVFIKGAECSHIVHVDDVAAAAMFFISRPFDKPRIFFVSADHEPLNTYSGVWSIYKAIEKNCPVDDVQKIPHLPLTVPHILRELYRGKCNRGDLRYSSARLLSEGFRFSVDLMEAGIRLVQYNTAKQNEDFF